MNRSPATHTASRIPRRNFLGRLVAVAAVLGVPIRLESQGGVAPQHGPDERWLQRLNGKHRQVFDAPSVHGGEALVQAHNFLNAYNSAYGVPDSELSVAIVVHGTGFPLVFNDATWERFSLGERFHVDDPATRTPSRRNVFSAVRPGDPVPAAASIETLQHRGVVLVLCNNTLQRTTAAIATAQSQPVASVREELLRGLLPGVTVVPSAVVALNRAQEHGLRYVFAG